MQSGIVDSVSCLAWSKLQEQGPPLLSPEPTALAGQVYSGGKQASPILAPSSTINERSPVQFHPSFDPRPFPDWMPHASRGHETYPATHPRGNGDAPALTPVASVRADFQRMASVPRRIQEPDPPCLPTARDPTGWLSPLLHWAWWSMPSSTSLLVKSQRRRHAVSLSLSLYDGR